MIKNLVGLVAVVALVGCGGSPAATTDSGVKVDAGSVDSGTIMTADGGTMVVAATCATYCAKIATNCSGATHEQYPNTDACLGACAALTQGTAGATAGNTLECRFYHAGAAAADPGVHCSHAGPSGAGVCGSDCESYCAIDLNACTGANAAFATLGDCTTACASFPSLTTSYVDQSTSGNTFSCRMYHLSVAASSSANATTHCPHTKTASAPCQ